MLTNSVLLFMACILRIQLSRPAAVVKLKGNKDTVEILCWFSVKESFADADEKLTSVLLRFTNRK